MTPSGTATPTRILILAERPGEAESAPRFVGGAREDVADANERN